MQISWSQLDQLPVITQSGEKIGKVEGVTVNIDEHVVQYYEVIPVKRLTSLFAKPFLISPRQVVSFTPEAMIVNDSVAQVESEKQSNKARLDLATANTETKLSEREG